MKFGRAVILFAVVSLALSSLVYYFGPDTIKYSLAGILAEIGTVAIVVFIFFIILYVIIKSAIKSAMAVKKKGLPKKKGPKV